MITPTDALKFAEHRADLRLLRARIAASRPDLAEADDAIGEALASLDSAAGDLRYAYVAIEDALGEADAIEAGDLIDTPLGTVRALDREVSMSEWQPIDSAPRDGTPFLAYGEDEDCSGMAVCYISVSGDICGDVGGHFLDEEDFTPTHWMPLPETPEAMTLDQRKRLAEIAEELAERRMVAKRYQASLESVEHEIQELEDERWQLVLTR